MKALMRLLHKISYLQAVSGVLAAVLPFSMLPSPRLGTLMTGTSDENADGDTAQAVAEAEPVYSDGVLQYDGTDYSVMLTYDASAQLPGGAALKMEEIARHSGAYDDYFAQTEAAVPESEELVIARFFDITILSDGEEIQPQNAVTVTISIDNTSNQDAEVVHFDNEPVLVETTEDDDALTFEADHFSVYGVAYTVDFVYDGLVYNLAGGGSILLSDLLAQLSVDEDVAGSRVAFRDDMSGLISLTPVCGSDGSVLDWQLDSLQPFTTKHTMTVKLSNGRTVEILVSDDVTLPVSGDDRGNTNITWTIDENGVMTVSGTGKTSSVRSWETSYFSWYPYRDLVYAIKIEDGITGIGDYSFANFPNVTTIDLSEASTLTDISYGFCNCTALESVLLPSQLKVIGAQAFAGCQELRNVNMEDLTELETIEYRAFAAGTYDYGHRNKVLDVDLSNCTKLRRIENEAFSGCTALSADLSALTNLEYIGATTFPASLVSADFSQLTKLTEIGFRAFDGDEAITTVDFSGNTALTVIGNDAFYRNKNLTSVDCSNCTSLTTIGNNAFSHRVGYESLTGLVTADFSGCTALTSIGDNAFNDAFHMTSADFSDCSALMTIGKNAFNNCRVMTSADLSGCSSLTTIGENAFKACAMLHEMDLSDCTALTTISDNAFSGCKGLSSVYVGGCKQLTNIGASAFENCSGMYVLDLRECTALTTIGAKAFSGCSSLESLVIPDSVTSVSSDSFLNCKGIQVLEWRAENYTENLDRDTFSAAGNYELHIGENVESLPTGFFKAMVNAGTLYFDSLPGGHVIHIKDESVTADGDSHFASVSHDIYVDEQGVVYELFDDVDTATVIYCPPGISDYTVPASVLADGKDYLVNIIAPSAFSEAKDMTAVRFAEPNNITSIGESAFYGLNNLAQVVDLRNGNTAVTIQQAKGLFPHAGDIPTSAFKRTALLDDDSHVWSPGFEADSLTVQDDEGSKVIIGAPTSGNYTLDGSTYRYMTGSYFNVPINVDTTNHDGCVVQIFMELSNSGYLGLDSSIVIMDKDNKTIATAVPMQTTNPDIRCLQFKLTGGSTAKANISVTFPTPTSDGGEMRLWVNIPDSTELSEEPVTPVMNTSVEGGNEYMHASWSTERRERSPRKVALSSRVSIRGSGDPENPDKYYVNGSSWRIFLDYTTDKKNANIGQDFATSAVYQDVLRLPAGIEWDEAILSAIRDGRYTFKNIRQSNNRRQCYLVIDGENVMYLEFPADVSAQRILFTVDDDDNLNVSWTLKNPSAQNDLSSDAIVFGVLDDALLMNLSEVTVEENGVERPAAESDFPLEFDIENEVTTRVSYTHSAISDPLTGTARMRAIADKAELVIEKAASGGARQFLGDDVTFTLTASNVGAQSTTGLNVIEDTLADGIIRLLYLTPENMERMFADTFGDRLTVTIQDATLFRWNAPEQTGAVSVTGAPVELNSRNSGSTSPKAEHVTLVITKAGEGYSVTCGSETKTGDSIKAILDDLGYLVTADAYYTVRWGFTENEDTFRMIGGSKVALPVYATHKDTFMLLDSDWPNRYKSPDDWSQTVKNSVDMHYTNYDAVGNPVQKLKTASVSQYSVYPEIQIGKNLITKPLSDGYVNNQLLSYTVSVSEMGKNAKENLPVTDLMTGAAILAVRADHNPELASLQLEEYTVGMTVYYLLTEGEYSNLYIGADATGKPLLADHVTVTRSVKDGDVSYTTDIAWYLQSLAGGESRAFHYNAIVRALDTDDEVQKSYQFENFSYANDKKDDRLFATFGISKKIVEEPGVHHAGETFDEDGFTWLSANTRTVTYKIPITYQPEESNWSVSFTGDELYDSLPQTFGFFAWFKGTEGVDTEGNVSLEVVTRGNVSLSEGFADSWSISNHYRSMPYADGQYYIVWDDSASITLTGDSELDLYVTLSFADEAAWSAYADAAQGRVLSNRVSLAGKEAAVTHDVRDKGKAYLQKGVNYVYQIGKTDSRSEYGNVYGHVDYYAVVYNGGSSRLYFPELTDILPRGFTFRGVSATAGAYGTAALGSTCTTLSNSQMQSNPNKPATVLDNGREATYVSVNVNAAVSGEQKVRFTLSGGSHYDKEYEQYYLLPHEAIIFSYAVDVDENAMNTDSTAVNRLIMEYSDPVGLGVGMYSFQSGGVTGCNRGDIPYNDGSCIRYGGDSGLQSVVTLTRGESVPGVRKRVVNYTENGETKPINNGEIVSAAQRIGWEITVRDAGYNDIRGYSVSDTIQYPYRFSGDVIYKTYDKDNNVVDTIYESAGTFERPLFTVNGYSADESAVILTDIQGNRYSVPIDGTEQTLSIPYIKQDYGNIHNIYQNSVTPLNFRVAFTEEAGVSRTMTITFDDDVLPLMPKCRGVLTLETETNIEISNVEIFNSAVFRPQDLSYRNIDDGKRLYKPDGSNDGVYAEANISISSGGGTSSVKAVTEDLHPDNTTDSEQEEPVITLGDKQNEFTYTLSVTNATGGVLDSLIIADHLPEVNDMFSLRSTIPRGSEFMVWFSENFETTAERYDFESGDTVPIPSSDYRVQYSDKVAFDEESMTNPDAAGWTEVCDPSHHRSIRFIFSESNGIGDGDTIRITFHARADASAKPGEVAYNGFVYWYQNNTLRMHASSKLVGIQVPTFPRLQKKTVNLFGMEYAPTEDKDFYFIVYRGGDLHLRSYPVTVQGGVPVLSEEALQALGTRKYQLATIRVRQGETYSDAESLYAHELWSDGEEYTLEELCYGDEFELRELTLTDKTATHSFTDGHLTFRYDNSDVQTLSGINTSIRWRFQINKTGSFTHNALPGAVFALYSPEAEDALAAPQIHEGFYVYDSQTKVPVTAVYNGSTWYLKAVSTTNQRGVILWDSLVRDSYLYREVKAPDGYKLPTIGFREVMNTDLDDVHDDVVTRDIVNEYSYYIPGSGGIGTHFLTIAGGALTLTAVGGIWYTRRRKRSRSNHKRQPY